MYDFHPASSEWNPEMEWCLLLLDGHNSHCSYEFVDFCEKHQIVLLCLPSHTTHRLQPCDIGVFGPLASCWKAEVNEASQQHLAIMKYNFLEIYTQTTIQSAFRKTGIHPFDPSMIEETAFSPALNTTMKPAQPISATLPDLLTKITIETPSLSSISNISHSESEVSIITTESSPPHHPHGCVHTPQLPITLGPKCIFRIPR
jgi:hypothetical protein